MTPMNTDGKDSRTQAIIGAAIEVHNQLGRGFLEAVYQEALAIELGVRGIPFRQGVELEIRYKGQVLRCRYIADLLCFGDIIVELKAISTLSGADKAQVLNYLRAAGLRLGLLINFGASRLEVRRLVFDPHLCSSVSSVDE